MARRCTLCGGKLNSQNICTECGLDNSKTDKNYKINESRNTPKEPASGNPPRQTAAPGAQKQKKYKKKGVPQIIAALGVLAIFFGMVAPFFEDLSFETENEEEFAGEGYEDYEKDPYGSVEREIPEEGIKEEYLLSRGDYIVGVHIPEGNYTAEGDDPSGTIQVEDLSNDIYLYQSMDGSESDYLEDLRLYRGAHVIIDTESVVSLSTENAQLSDMYGIQNPLTETVQITGDRTLEAGKDFAPGVYDLKVKEGYGMLDVVFSREEEESYEEYTVRAIYFSEGDCTEYKNLVLAPGMKLMFEDAESVSLRLIPSESIENMEYEAYYAESEDYLE